MQYLENPKRARLDGKYKSRKVMSHGLDFPFIKMILIGGQMYRLMLTIELLRKGFFI